MNELAKEIAQHLLADDPILEDRIQRGIEENRKGTGSIRLFDKEGKPVAAADIRLKHVRHEFHFGCNCFMLGQFKEAEKNASHDEAFTRLFNLAVVPFYWADLEPEEGKPRFAKDSPVIYRRPATDLVVEFCEKHNIAAKGHPLCWHHPWFQPKWLPTDKRGLALRLERRIAEIAARYSHRIHIWDVCNEALAYPVNEFMARQPENYVELTFELAARYFPRSAVLTYNDCVCWDLHGDYTPFYMLGRHLKNLNVNLGAMGLQFHMFIYSLEEWRRVNATMLNPRYLLACLDQYAKLGVPLNMSEITITAREELGDGLTFQREVAERLYRLWFSHPAMDGITYWNMIDNTAYQTENQWKGGLLNADLSPKPAYTALERLIHKEWCTQTQLGYRAGALNQFRGFYGDYDVTIHTNAGTVKRQLTLSRHSQNCFEFTLD